MSFFVVDIEADGEIPFKYSMVSLGVVKLEENLEKAPTFYSTIKPISEFWKPEALAISGFTREETLTFEEPKKVMEKLAKWIKHNNKNGRAVFLSDNNGFDFAWINWYFHYFLGENPFGFSSRRIGDFYAGLSKDWYAQWKQLRRLEHNHNALQDAMSNADAFLEIIKAHDIKINLK